MNAISKWIAPVPTFKIDIQTGSVDVRLDAATASPRRRFFIGAFCLILVLFVDGVGIFGRAKSGGPTLAQDVARGALNSPSFLIFAAIMIGWHIVLFFILRRSLQGFYPVNETFHCDASTLTISKVKWFDTTNTQWSSRTFPIGRIVQVRFATIASDRYRSVSGLRFRVDGEKFKVLPGLQPRQANKILDALQDLGVDIKETYRSKKRMPTRAR